MEKYLPFISVVICTRNRSKQLYDALSTFKRLSYSGPWEMVIVDNSSTDGTYEVALNFALDSGMNVRVIKENRVGLSCARNAGVNSTKGDIVAFTDDDCYPRKNYLSAIADVFQDPSIDFCGGRVMLFDKNDRRVTIQEDKEIKLFGAGEFIPSGWIHGANMICRRNVLLKINGFDERLGAGTRFKSGEDTDLLRRLSFLGSKGRYSPEICVFHHHGRKTDSEEILLRKGYDRGIAAVMVKGIVNPNTRSICLRNWYWSLRHAPLSRKLRQFYFGMLFWLSAGPTLNRILRHPSFLDQKD